MSFFRSRVATKAWPAYTLVSQGAGRKHFISAVSHPSHSPILEMSSIKQVIEILASSEQSFEDALQRALASLSSSVPNISSIYIKDQSCKVRDHRIVEYRITAKVSFGTPVEAFDTSALEHTFDEAPVPAGNGAPDYSHVAVKTEPELPREVEPGGSATEAESGGGYSG